LSEDDNRLPQHETIPLDVRQRVSGLVAAAERIRKVLTAPSALPEVRARAKDELLALSKEAAAIWSIV
jgi:hypothetical protein